MAKVLHLGKMPKRSYKSTNTAQGLHNAKATALPYEQASMPDGHHTDTAQGPHDAKAILPLYEQATTPNGHFATPMLHAQVSPALSNDHHKSEQCKSSRHTCEDCIPAQSKNGSTAA